MNIKRFNDVVGEFVEKEDELLALKGEEYSNEYDRLLNFREIAAFLGEEPADVCLSYLLKHIQSISQAIRQGNYTKKWYWNYGNSEGLKQRVADARNYLLLLAACIEEQATKDEI